jgi:hypothetical protein
VRSFYSELFAQLFEAAYASALVQERRLRHAFEEVRRLQKAWDRHSLCHIVERKYEGDEYTMSFTELWR